ncbi:MAG: hypothetical protein V4567_02255 [Pseudomonadota bacterium]
MHAHHFSNFLSFSMSPLEIRLDQVKRMYLENDGGFSVICA